MNKIFAFWISILPLVVWNGHFEVPKVFYFLIGVVFLILNLVINYKKVVIRDYDKWYFLWLLTLLISSFLSEDIKTSILGGSYRHQGLIFFLGLWVTMKSFETFKDSEKIFTYKLVGITVLIESLLVLLGFKLGTVGDTNAVSGLLAMGLGLMAISLPKLFGVIPIISMLINFSKAGFLSLVPLLFRKKYLFLILISVLLIFILKPINNASFFENRNVIWKHAANLIAQNPIVGYGLESNERIFDQAFSNSGFPLSNLIIDRAHNLFLDITLWSGLLGTFSFTGFLFLKFKSLNEKMRRLLITFLIYSTFQPLSVAHWIFIALLV